MSNTKVCPACQKTLPVLAVRCKFCGFKQPLNRDDDGAETAENGNVSDGEVRQDITGDGPKKSTLPPAKIGAGTQKAAGKGKRKRLEKKSGKTSKNPPNANVGASSARQSTGAADSGKPALFGKTRKRTLMGPGVLDSAASKKNPFQGPAKKFGSGTPLKPMLGQEKKPSSGFGQRDSRSDAGEPDHRRASLAGSDPSPSTRPSKKPTRPAMSAIPEKPPASKDIEDTESINDSDILALDDDSQLVVLDSDDQSGTVELDLDALSTASVISEMPDDETTDDKRNGEAKQSPLGRVSAIARVKARQLVSGALEVTGRGAAVLVDMVLRLKTAILKRVPGLRKVPLKAWVIAGGLAVVLVGTGIGLMRGCGGDAALKEETAPRTEKEKSAQPPKKSHARKSANQSTEDSPVHTGASGKCRPASAYGAFLWQNELVTLLEKFGRTAVCDLMGQSFASMVAALAEENSVMVGVIDGLPDSAGIEIVPSDAAALGARGIRLIFHQTKLIRVVLDYGKARDIGLDLDDFEALLETDVEKTALGELTVYGLDDGALRIELVQERGDEKQRELQFTASGLDGKLMDRLDGQRRARRFLIKANEYVRQRQYSNATDAFQSAVDANDACGAAWVGRAMAQVYLEDFSGARAAAEKALDVSEDTLVRSMAAQALAFVFLRSGDKKRAIAQLEQAVTHNSDNAEAALALRELKTGKYNTERVAITAARMSCPEALGATLQGLLAKGNFPDTQTFFNALRTAKMDIRFERLKREWVSRECR